MTPHNTDKLLPPYDHRVLVWDPQLRKWYPGCRAYTSHEGEAFRLETGVRCIVRFNPKFWCDLPPPPNGESI